MTSLVAADAKEEVAEAAGLRHRSDRRLRALIEPVIPSAELGGSPRKAATRDLVDAILYILRAGGGWRVLPHDLPPWQTVYY